MTCASDQTIFNVPSGSSASRRNLEFAQALDDYMTSYVAESGPRHDRSGRGSIAARKAPRGKNALRRLAAFIVEALQHVDDPMSAGGGGPPVGIM